MGRRTKLKRYIVIETEALTDAQFTPYLKAVDEMISEWPISSCLATDRFHGERVTPPWEVGLGEESFADVLSPL